MMTAENDENVRIFITCNRCCWAYFWLSCRFTRIFINCLQIICCADILPNWRVIGANVAAERRGCLATVMIWCTSANPIIQFPSIHLPVSQQAKQENSPEYAV
jgi:hypothetical protein